MKALRGPRFLHVVTRKGQGYEPAEGDPLSYHGVVPFDPDTGKVEKKATNRTFTQVFGSWLCDMAASDNRVIAITPAMREGSGLVQFSQQYPRSLFRRRYCGTTRDHLCRRTGVRRSQTRRSHLFYVSAARLRPADS